MKAAPIQPAALTLAAAGLLAAPGFAQSTTDVLERLTEARGGASAIEAIQSVELRLTINEGWELEGHYRATRDGSMRIDVFADGERVFTEALHEGEAWALQQGETAGAPITPEEAAILWRGVLGNLYGLHEFEEHGVEVTTRHEEETDDGVFWVVELLHPDGFEEHLYLDRDSWLVARKRSDHALHPAVDPEVKRFESRYSDYREVDGVLFPFLVEKYDLESGERVQLTTVRSREHNTIEGRGDFVMPR